MEFWKNQYSNTPILHYSNSTILQYSIFSIFHYSITPVLQCSVYLASQIDDLHAVVRFRMLRRGSLCQNHNISINAVCPQPLPGEGLPVFWVFGLMNRVDPIRKLQCLASRFLRTHCHNPYGQPESGNTSGGISAACRNKHGRRRYALKGCLNAESNQVCQTQLLISFASL